MIATTNNNIYIYTCMYRLPTFIGTCSKVGPCPATFSTFSKGGWWWMGVRETFTLVGNWGCVGVPMTWERKPQILGRWWERNLKKKVGQTLNHLLFLLLVNHLFKEHIYIYIYIYLAAKTPQVQTQSHGSKCGPYEIWVKQWWTLGKSKSHGWLKPGPGRWLDQQLLNHSTLVAWASPNIGYSWRQQKGAPPLALLYKHMWIWTSIFFEF